MIQRKSRQYYSTRIPQLLINGSSGIAVGMATSIMPHNLSEVIDGVYHILRTMILTIDELMHSVKAPDFLRAALSMVWRE